MDIASRSIQGDRSTQDDFYRITEIGGGLLAVLCDGMGGYHGGDVASRLATDTMTAHVAAGLGPTNGPGSGTPSTDAMVAGLLAANAKLMDVKQQDPALDAMGTTLLGFRIENDRLAWISVGDSPFWLLRDDALVRLNEDHSMRGDASRAGGAANVLRSSVSGDPIPLIDVSESDLMLCPGDMLIAASDGILTLDELAIAAATHRCRDAETAVQALIGAVIDRGKSRQDNCSVIAIVLHAAAVADKLPHPVERPAARSATPITMRHVLTVSAISVAVVLACIFLLRSGLSSLLGGL